MPLELKSVDGSFSGTKGADGISACPLALKKSIYFFRTIEDVIFNSRFPYYPRYLLTSGFLIISAQEG